VVKHYVVDNSVKRMMKAHRNVTLYWGVKAKRFILLFNLTTVGILNFVRVKNADLAQFRKPINTW